MTETTAERRPDVVHLQSTDPYAWADEWASIIRDHPDVPHDREAMMGWFANAIMVGYDRGVSRERARERPFDLGDVVYLKLADGRLAGMVTAAFERPGSVLYEVSWGNRTTTAHYAMELTAEYEADFSA